MITEAREGGTAGIFDAGGGMRTELIGEIAQAVGVANVIFEAPSKAAQAWFVKQFGPEVNLGNIPPEEVIPLETLRLGLRGDTLKEILLAGEQAPRTRLCSCKQAPTAWLRASDRASSSVTQSSTTDGERGRVPSGRRRRGPR